MEHRITTIGLTVPTGPEEPFAATTPSIAEASEQLHFLPLLFEALARR
jgi:hypothetical protein